MACAGYAESVKTKGFGKYRSSLFSYSKGILDTSGGFCGKVRHLSEQLPGLGCSSKNVYMCKLGVQLVKPGPLEACLFPLRSVWQAHESECRS